jgi:sugar (pentulose or hexulose) kinase
MSETTNGCDRPVRLLGVDAGLTKIKAALFAPDGTEVTVASRATPTDRPTPDHHEVDLDTLWHTVAEVIREVLTDCRTDAEHVAAVGIAGHGHGLYLLDADGEQVRPGIQSTDSRATDLVEEWERSGQATAVQEILGYEPFAADPLSLVGWVKNNEPEAYSEIDRLLFCKDYIKYRLTGQVYTDEMEGSVFYDPTDGTYAPDVFDVLELDECTDALPEVVPSWEACGKITETAAEETGLDVGTPVASGLHDVGATALGVGAHRPGQGALIVGTWGQSIAVLDSPQVASNEASGLTRRYLDGGWLRYKGNRSAAACVDWFVEECGSDWNQQATEENVTPYEMYNRVVADVSAGAEGLLFHPYLHGSTDDPRARAGFYGLTTEHTKAHMLRAIYEGVAISQIERLTELRPQTGLDDVRLGGGGARSEIWAQIFTDVRGDDISVPAGEEAGALGAAICAALVAGIYPDHGTAVDRMVSLARHHEPDSEVATEYEEYREIFEGAYSAIEPTWERLRTAGGTNEER